MNRKSLAVISLVLLFVLACGSFNPVSTTSTPVFVITEQEFVPATPALPISEDAVERVSLERAVVAFAAGEAIFLDVRSPQSYAEGHIPGAINIPLDKIELNPTALDLDTQKWIITYCT